MSFEKYPAVIRFGFMSVLLYAAVFLGSSAAEPGRGNLLAEPPPIESEESYQRRQERTLASDYREVRSVGAKDASQSVSVSYFAGLDARALFAPFGEQKRSAPGQAERRVLDLDLRETYLGFRMLRYRDTAVEMGNLGIADGLGLWQLPPEARFKDVFLRVSVGSRHYYPADPARPFREENPGVLIDFRGLGRGPFSLGSWGLSFGMLRNTTGGVTGLGCVPWLVPLYEQWGFTLSGGLSNCIGYYRDKYRERTSLLVGSFPTFSLERGDSSFDLTLLTSRGFPFERADASLLSLRTPMERAQDSSTTKLSGMFFSWEKKF